MARTALATGMNPMGPFAVAVDARRSMLYFGLYDETGQRLDGPLLVAPDEAVDLLPNALSVAVGSGAALLADAVARRARFLDAKLPGLQPSAAALAEIARSSDESFPTLRPLYLRPPDAKPQTPLMATRR